MEESLYLEKKEEIGTIYINRAEKKNAFNVDMWKLLTRLLEEAENDPEIKVVVIRGVDDTTFVAGADISEFTKYKTVEERMEKNNKYMDYAIEYLYKYKKPTIAMIQKYCIGAGCSIAVACDFRFSDTNGIFGITASKIGLVYGFHSTRQLVELIGPAYSKYLLMTGKRIDAKKALEIGLVHEVFEPEEIENETYRFAKTLCSRSQFSLRGMKKMIHIVTDGLKEPNEATEKLVFDSYESIDHKEGVEAFLQKRKPVFQYR